MFHRTETSRTLQTRERIIGAARSLLAEGGVGACSMRSVAERAGITAAAIYRHFAGKEALVGAVLDETLRGFERSLLEAIVSLPVGSFARVAALGESYVRFAEDHREEFRVLFMPAGNARLKLSEIPGKVGYRILRRSVAEAIENGEIRRADPDLVALFLWSRVHGIVTLSLACDVSDEWSGGESLDAQSLMNLTREFVLDGLRPGSAAT